MDKHIKQVILVNILLGTKPKALEPLPVGILIPEFTKGRLLQFSLCVVQHLGRLEQTKLLKMSFPRMRFSSQFQGKNVPSIYLNRGLVEFKLSFPTSPSFHLFHKIFLNRYSEPSTVNFSNLLAREREKKAQGIYLRSQTHNSNPQTSSAPIWMIISHLPIQLM